jgi:hypothetical protein
MIRFNNNRLLINRKGCEKPDNRHKMMKVFRKKSGKWLRK